MSSEYSNLLVELKESTAVVSINRPDQLNALNIETIDELHKAFETLDKNEEVKVDTNVNILIPVSMLTLKQPA